MKRTSIALLLAASLAVPVLAGCSNGSSSSDSASRNDPNKHSMPGPAQNDKNADELLREARQAEQRDDYSRALECYNQLRSFPKSAQPADLDQRINDLNAKVKAGHHPGD